MIDLCTTDAHPRRNILRLIGVVTVRNPVKYGTFRNDRQGEETLKMLAVHAAGLGASGVVGVRMIHIGDAMSAYGTAVIFE
ncbi:YbjQ family protein [Acidithiobacillus ferrivorans]|nr:YbjQ family protein [Acidithiobacillus ferrivorans]